MSGEAIHSKLVGAFAKALEKSNAKDVSIGKVQLTDEELVELSKGLTGLESLELSDNLLTSASGDVIAKILKSNPNLKTLLLGINQIGQVGFASFAKEMKEHPALEHFSCNSCNLTPESAKDVLQLVSNPKLNHLDLRGNGITCDGAEEIAEAIKVTVFFCHD